MLIDIHFVLIPLCLFWAALFAAAETSLFALSRSQLESLKDTRPMTYKRIRDLIYRPDSLLSTIIISNELINIAIGTFVVAVIFRWGPFLSERWLPVLCTLISSTLILLFSEILPKALAFRIPVLTASVLAYPTSWFHALLTPLRTVFLFVSREFIKLFGVTPRPPSVVSAKELVTLVEFGAESGSLEAEEKERIVNVFKLSEMPVSSIMTPWERVFYLKETLGFDEALAQVRRHPYSRIPVLSERGDVSGILYSKELLKGLLSKMQTDSIQPLLDQPYIVSSHKKISKLFGEFKSKKIHMALVVDEYGKQVGVITLEDILNALFKTAQRQENIPIV